MKDQLFHANCFTVWIFRHAPRSVNSCPSVASVWLLSLGPPLISCDLLVTCRLWAQFNPLPPSVYVCACVRTCLCVYVYACMCERACPLKHLLVQSCSGVTLQILPSHYVGDLLLSSPPLVSSNVNVLPYIQHVSK